MFAQDMSDGEKVLMNEHGRCFQEQFTAGRVLLSGPVMATDGTFGLAILEVDDEAEARQFGENDPSVRAGLNRFEVYPMRSTGSTSLTATHRRDLRETPSPPLRFKRQVGFGKANQDLVSASATAKRASCCRCAKRRPGTLDRDRPLPSSRPLVRSLCDHTTRPRLADGEAGKTPCSEFYGDRVCGTSRSDVVRAFYPPIRPSSGWMRSACLCTRDTRRTIEHEQNTSRMPRLSRCPPSARARRRRGRRGRRRQRQRR